MKITLPFISLLFLVPVFVAAQSEGFLKVKPGKYLLENHLQTHTGLDYAALVNSATSVATWFQQNHGAIKYPCGFDANLNMFGNYLPAGSDAGYGEVFRLNFSFHYFYVENDVVKTASGWLAHGFEIWFNNPFHALAEPLKDRGFEDGDDPSLKQTLNQAHERLQHFYTLRPLEKNLAPGVDLYAGQQLLVSMPGQPSPWIQVTVGEVTKAILDYYKIRKASDEYKLKKTLEKMPDDYRKLYLDGSKTSVYDLVLKEFESLTPEDMNKPAYLDKGDGLYNINTNGNGVLVVKYNPDCWNRSWPRTSVQFISMKYSITNNEELERFRKNNRQLEDYVGHFMNALPVEKMGELIRR